MSSLDQHDIFGSGPHTIRVQSPQRQLDHRTFSGLDGELVLDMGLRGRQIAQHGRLSAATASLLDDLLIAIEATVDGQPHTLVDNYGRQYHNLVVEDFQPTTPVQHGRSFWCDYSINYRQLI